MDSSPNNPSTGDLVQGAFAAGTGLGIVTMALFPLAIPLLALTAVALVPLLMIPLIGGLIAGPFLLLRWLLRRGGPHLQPRGSGPHAGGRSGRPAAELG